MLITLKIYINKRENKLKINTFYTIEVTINCPEWSIIVKYELKYCLK